MEAPALFSIASKWFAPSGSGKCSDREARSARAEHEEMCAPETWGAFLEAASAAALPRSLRALAGEGGLKALESPPAYEDHRAFCRRHFTGGLAVSAMPVESIYRSRRRDAGGKGSYCDDSALYMRDLIARLGLSLPGEYAAYPDHLALELDMLAVLQRSGCAHEARSFSAERFGWLPDYRRQLARLADDAAVFYIALIDVLIASTDAGGLCGRCDTDLRADSGGAPAAGVRPCPVRPM